MGEPCDSCSLKGDPKCAFFHPKKTKCWYARRVAELEATITKAYNADCEYGDDGGVVEGEAAAVLAPFLKEG